MGGRVQQVARTKATLEGAALSLFAQRDYDAISVADIACAAGVTERTFFRHFPTKDAVLFHRSRALFDLLGARLAAHVDAANPTWDAVQRALEAYAVESEAAIERFDIVVQLVVETPSLAARRREHLSLWQEWAVEVLAASGGAVRAAHVAPIVLATMYRGEEIWAEARGATTRVDAMRQAVAEAKDAAPR